jgi:hypothetical protein
MARLHLFEIHDFPWCPSLFRDSLTDFLAISIARFDNYAPIRQLLFQSIEKSGCQRVIDLCSGGGGPWQAWSASIPQLPEVLLTDKFPNRSAAASTGSSNVSYYGNPVDATNVPDDLRGFRTIFTAAHHFRPEMVRRMIADAVAKRQPIGIFEFTQRSARGLFHVALTGLGVWLLTPQTNHVSLAKLFFTYIVPVIPVVATFDGIVSSLRTYKPEELAALVDGSNYDWQIGTTSGKGVPVTYLIGLPKPDEEQS